MTDEELVKRMRSQIGDDVQCIYDHEALFRIAADRIEQLVVAGRAYREATRHFKPCPETSANFDAALKGN